MSDQTGHSKRSTLWTLASVASALSLPSLLWLGQPFWQLPLDLLSPLLLLALGHTLVLLTTSFGGRTTVSRLGISILLLLAVFGFAYGYQWLRPDVSFSRVVGGLWLLLSITLLVAGHMLRGGARLAATALLAVAIGYALLPRARPAPEHALATDATPVAPHEQLLVSAYYPLGLTVHEDIVDPADVQSGGGIAALGDGLIAMTGGGAFYRLAWNPDSKTVDHHRLPLESPTNAEAFDAAMPQFVIRDWFRTHDLVTRRAGDRWEVFVSHHVFDEARRCVQVVVSRAALNDGLDVVDVNWQELYRLEPCLPTAGDTGVENFAGLEAGGRLAWLDSSQLILTAGDHQFDGWNRATIAAQDPSYDYGKTLVIDVSTGRARRLTYGHRNPQGLWVDADRSIWTTEHGPQGGDELNLLVEGGNYGWPYITYGTESNRLIWPPEEAHSDPVSSIDPVYAWVPSIGISNLIRVNGAPFARWKGHFLIGSLKGTTLYRLELVEGHVAYAEPRWTPKTGN